MPKGDNVRRPIGAVKHIPWSKGGDQDAPKILLEGNPYLVVLVENVPVTERSYYRLVRKIPCNDELCKILGHNDWWQKEVYLCPVFTKDNPQCVYQVRCMRHSMGGLSLCEAHDYGKSGQVSELEKAFAISYRAERRQKEREIPEFLNKPQKIEGEIEGIVPAMEGNIPEKTPNRRTLAFVNANIRRAFHLPSRYEEEYEASLADPQQLSLKRHIASNDARLKELQDRLSTGESAELWKSLNWHLTGINSLWKNIQNEPNEEKRDELLRTFGHQLESTVAIAKEGATEENQWADIKTQQTHIQSLVETQLKVLQVASDVLTRDQAGELLAAICAIIKKHVTNVDELAGIGRDIQEMSARLRGFFAIKGLSKDYVELPEPIDHNIENNTENNTEDNETKENS